MNDKIGNNHEVKFLIVDDDEVDRRNLVRLFHKAKLSNEIVEAFDGQDALEVLRGKNGADPLKNPYIVLLDLNMPRMGGIEFLQAIRADPQLRETIVFVLSTSDAKTDKSQAYNLNVVGYIVKDEPDVILDVILMIDHYQRVIELPDGN